MLPPIATITSNGKFSRPLVCSYYQFSDFYHLCFRLHQTKITERLAIIWCVFSIHCRPIHGRCMAFRFQYTFFPVGSLQNSLVLTFSLTIRDTFLKISLVGVVTPISDHFLPCSYILIIYNFMLSLQGLEGALQSQTEYPLAVR